MAKAAATIAHAERAHCPVGDRGTEIIHSTTTFFSGGTSRQGDRRTDRLP